MRPVSAIQHGAGYSEVGRLCSRGPLVGVTPRRHHGRTLSLCTCGLMVIKELRLTARELAIISGALVSLVALLLGAAAVTLPGGGLTLGAQQAVALPAAAPPGPAAPAARP